jgi:hypothetical protein
VGYGLLNAPLINTRLISVGVALLSFSLLLRELDLDRLSVPHFIQLERYCSKAAVCR